jgi:hypothetical protein
MLTGGTEPRSVPIGSLAAAHHPARGVAAVGNQSHDENIGHKDDLEQVAGHDTDG